MTTETPKNKADPSIWVDGTDSEARRAARTPDPTHTPAVRRAVHWEADDCQFSTPEAAYRHVGNKAARAAMRKIGFHPKDWPRHIALLPIGTADKIGRLIRRRDEEAGYR